MRGGLLALAALGLALGTAGAASSGTQQVPPMLVFARGGDLYRTTIDGAETVRLTRTKVREGSPAASPDALSIAYVRGADELWVIDVGGTEARRIVGRRQSILEGGVTTAPSWSPRGEMIYLTRWHTRSTRCGSIFRVGATGRVLKRVSRANQSESDAAVSPDGRRLALSASSYCDPGWSGRLAIVDTSGRPTRDLRRFRSPAGFDVQPAWSPDGGRLAFVGWDFGESDLSAIYTVNRDGSDVRRLTRGTFETRSPAWSPDGEWIAFSKEGGLFLIRPDGTGLHRIPGTANGDIGPSWLRRT